MYFGTFFSTHPSHLFSIYSFFLWSIFCCSSFMTSSYIMYFLVTYTKLVGSCVVGYECECIFISGPKVWWGIFSYDTLIEPFYLFRKGILYGAINICVFTLTCNQPSIITINTSNGGIYFLLAFLFTIILDKIVW